MNWNIVAYTSLAIGLFLMIWIIILKIIINKRYTLSKKDGDFFEDYKLDEKYIDNIRYSIFRPQTASMNVIDKYVISYEDKYAYLICDFFSEMNHVAMKVYAYNRYKRLIGIYYINQSGKFKNTSKIIMNAEVAYINIVMQEKNEELDIETMKEDKKYLIKLKTRLSSVMLFFLLIFTSYLSIYLINQKYVERFLSMRNRTIIISSIFGICILNYLINTMILNKREKIGGKK